MGRGENDLKVAPKKIARKRAPSDVREVGEILKDNQDTILSQYLADPDGQWQTRGTIRYDGTVDPIASDTKSISKILEDNTIRAIGEILEKHGYGIEHPKMQNSYPDLTVHTPRSNSKVALDAKTSYRRSEERINGFTLGTFRGYFLDPTSSRNTVYPYGEYSQHRIYGVIYDRNEVEERDGDPYPQPLIGNFTLINQEKYAVAGVKPGSGNTQNIGSIKEIDSLVKGQGPFVILAKDIGRSANELFEIYWRNYGTRFSNILEFEKLLRQKKI